LTLSIHYSDTAKHPHVLSQLAALKNLLAAGVPMVHTTTVLHGENMRQAETLTLVLAKLGVRHMAYSFCVPEEGANDGPEAFELKYPRPEKAVEKAVALCRLCEKLGVRPLLKGFPVCLLPESSRKLTDTWQRTHAHVHKVVGAVSTVTDGRRDGGDAGACPGCSLWETAACRGLDATYAARYPDVALVPFKKAA